MDSDERLLALKKAYADIILNTSKEAAARIMVSERKGLRFQHELAVAKEEAVQMMLRLKKMMDAKLSEAELISRSQQGKIEELEAQLQEAEDIVNDLREELRCVQDKLERVASSVQYENPHDTVTPEEALEENGQYASQSVIHPHPYDSLALLRMRNSYGTKPELPSIILRSKEHEFYRNGCTQRIRACEGQLVDSELCLSRKADDGNHDKKVNGEEEANSTCPLPTDEVDMICTEKKEAVLEDSRPSSWNKVRGRKSSRRKGNRNTMYRKNRSTSCKSNQFIKTAQTPGISFLNTSLNSVKDGSQPEEDPIVVVQKLSSGVSAMNTHMKCAETTESTDIKGCSAEILRSKIEASTDILVPTGQEGGSLESFHIHVSERELEKVDESILHSKCKASGTSNEGSSQLVDHRAIKYTFQRKRKRETSTNSDGNVSHENSPAKGKTEEKEHGSADPEKTCLVTESSRESRRLAQVARQLISLSGKKW